MLPDVRSAPGRVMRPARAIPFVMMMIAGVMKPSDAHYIAGLTGDCKPRRRRWDGVRRGKEE
jgi:hypothetical protein